MQATIWNVSAILIGSWVFLELFSVFVIAIDPENPVAKYMFFLGGMYYKRINKLKNKAAKEKGDTTNC